MVGPFHDACLEERFLDAKGIITEHIAQFFAAALSDSYVTLGKILTSQGLKFKYELESESIAK